MDVGKPRRTIKVEPLKDPVPRETPAPAPSEEPRKTPDRPKEPVR
jgi:hypothetical protein